MNHIYKLPTVETKADLNKKVEIEMTNLIYFNYMNKDEAFKEAVLYVEEKYKSVVEKLKFECKY